MVLSFFVFQEKGKKLIEQRRRRATEKQVEYILEQCYSQLDLNPKELGRNKAFSSEVLKGGVLSVAMVL